jgi:hypothetical protein
LKQEAFYLHLTVAVSWKFEDYLAKAGKKKADQAEFQGICELDANGESKLFDIPHSVVDAKERFLFWYLPSVILQS